MECPTIRNKATTGSYPFTTINEADFDAAKHERYVEGESRDAVISAAADDIAATAMKMDEVLTPARMNKADLLAHLTSLSVEHDASMTKAELLALLS